MQSHIGSKRYLAGLLDGASGHLNPLRYGLGLAKAAEQHGAALYENRRAVSMKRVGDQWEVRTPEATVLAKDVIFADNCALLWQSPELAKPLHARMTPVGTYITATEPLPKDLMAQLLPSNAAVCDNNFVLDYFRFGAD